MSGIVDGTPRQGLRTAAARGDVAIAACLLSAGAAAIHAAVAGPHVQEYAPFGVLFIATALGQAAWSALVLTAPSPGLFALGALANAGVVVAWVASRTIGMPVGPAPWQPEAITALDLAATGFETAVVLACVLLLAVGGPYTVPSAPFVKRSAAIGAAAVAGLTCAAFAAAPSAADHHAVPTAKAADAQVVREARGATKKRAAREAATKQPATATSRAGSSAEAAHAATPHTHPAP